VEFAGAGIEDIKAELCGLFDEIGLAALSVL